MRVKGGFGSPYLVHDVFERVGAVDGEADKEDVGLWVGKRAQAVVLLLAGRVPEGELHHLARGGVRCVGDIVLEHGGHVFLTTLAVGCELRAASCEP